MDMNMVNLVPTDPRGRQSKLNHETHQIVIEGIKQNLPYRVVAWKAGVCEPNFYKWLEKGEACLAKDMDNEYTRLVLDIHKAEADKIASHLAEMEQNKKGWKARLKILEKRWHDMFGSDSPILQDLMSRMEKMGLVITQLTAINNGLGASIDSQPSQANQNIKVGVMELQNLANNKEEIEDDGRKEMD
jgi:hypothetical protein